jgi:hypothetical protein
MYSSMDREKVIEVFTGALESSYPEASVEDLVCRGFDINVVDATGRSLLTTVLDDVEKSRILVKCGANPFVGVYPRVPVSTTIDVINVASERSLDRFARFIDVLRKYDGRNDTFVPQRGTILSSTIDSGDYLLTKVALLKGVNTEIPGITLIDYALERKPNVGMLRLLFDLQPPGETSITTP